MNNEKQKSIYAHHSRSKLCTTRPKYRASKRLTAVKVYTVANESKYLLVFGVPIINLQNEIRREFQKYGTLDSVENVTVEQLKKGIDIERFTDCFKVTFEKIENARRSKKFTDDKNFYGAAEFYTYPMPQNTKALTIYERNLNKENLNDKSYQQMYGILNSGFAGTYI